jgi:hypothetical protein
LYPPNGIDSKTKTLYAAVDSRICTSTSPHVEKSCPPSIPACAVPDVPSPINATPTVAIDNFFMVFIQLFPQIKVELVRN